MRRRAENAHLIWAQASIGCLDHATHGWMVFHFSDIYFSSKNLRISRTTSASSMMYT